MKRDEVVDEPKSHRDLGFTGEEFYEIVDFFHELIKLNQKGKKREQLVQVLRGRKQQLLELQKKSLLEELARLELLQ